MGFSQSTSSMKEKQKIICSYESNWRNSFQVTVHKKTIFHAFIKQGFLCKRLHLKGKENGKYFQNTSTKPLEDSHSWQNGL